MDRLLEKSYRADAYEKLGEYDLAQRDRATAQSAR